MKHLFLSLPLGLLLMAFCLNSHANNISVSNVYTTGQNTTDGYIMVQFDINWENSWRIDNLHGDGITNWDAAWVFIKYRLAGGDWQHAKLNNSGNTKGNGIGALIQVGLVDETAAFDNSTNPAVGAFIYRSAIGVGNFALAGTRLRWNYRANGLADDAVVDIKVFAVEMVYVPQGSFYVGSGGTETSAFYTYPNTTSPYLISSENAINVGTTNGYLYYASSTYGGDQSGPIPAAFPKGYAGFYCMKYEIVQQQYVDFLNTLTQTQANARKFTASDYRYGITGNNVGSYATTNPYVACNYLNWDDGTAYSDWSGLRPMSELEFEKLAAGRPHLSLTSMLGEQLILPQLNIP